MKKTLLAIFIAAGFAGSLAAAAKTEESEPVQINPIVDLSHSFSFYGDGRFFTQYLPDVGGRWRRNLASFRAMDLPNANANLLVLLGTDPRLPYTLDDVKQVMSFVQNGGTVLLATRPSDPNFAEFKKVLDVDFVRGDKQQIRATPGIRIYTGLESDSIRLEGRPNPGYVNPGTINPLGLRWQPLVVDQDKNMVVGCTKFGQGRLLMIPRSMLGERPDAKDSINHVWLRKLIPALVTKPVQPGPPKNRDFANQDYKATTDDALVIHYNEYLKPYYEAMKDIQAQCRPAIEKRMGVPLHGKNASEIALLATDGGGFSSGKLIALAVFWGNFPARKEGMIEFITHETVHSWVLPFPEIWNEPIATYVGDLVMCDLGYPEEGMKRIQAQINSAKRIDPTLVSYDLRGNPVKPGARKLKNHEYREIEWGKTYAIFEELRAEKPDAIARYFKAKRQYADPAKIKRYGLPETIAVWSIAMDKDLFPWFAERGLIANPSQSQIPYPAK